MALVVRVGRRVLISPATPTCSSSIVSVNHHHRRVHHVTPQTIVRASSSSTSSGGEPLPWAKTLPPRATPSTTGVPSPASASASVQSHAQQSSASSSSSYDSSDWSTNVMSTILSGRLNPTKQLETFAIHRARLSTANVLATLASVSQRWYANTIRSSEGYAILNPLLDEVVKRVTVTATTKPSAELLTGCLEYMSLFPLQPQQFQTLLPLLTLTHQFLDAATQGIASDQKIFAFSLKSPKDTLWSRLVGRGARHDSIFTPDPGVRWSPEHMLSLCNALLHLRTNLHTPVTEEPLITAIQERLYDLIERSIEVKPFNRQGWTPQQLDRFFHVLPFPQVTH
jgi:hypothetical protein